MSRRGTSAGFVDTLKIDKDCFVDTKWVSEYVRLIIDTCRLYQLEVVSIKMCRSERKGLHFYIQISPSVEPRIANRLQWLLGDDCLRVDYNRARINSGLRDWNKLFEVVGRRLRTVYRRTTSHGHCSDKVTTKGGEC